MWYAYISFPIDQPVFERQTKNLVEAGMELSASTTLSLTLLAKNTMSLGALLLAVCTLQFTEIIAVCSFYFGILDGEILPLGKLFHQRGNIVYQAIRPSDW